MTRKQLILAHMRHCGYQGDRERFTRLFIENRITRADADAAYRSGVRRKQLETERAKDENSD